MSDNIQPTPWKRNARTSGYTGADKNNPDKPSKTQQRKKNRLDGTHKPSRK